MMSLVVVVGNLNIYWKYFLGALCYFVALSAYESVILIPAIVLVLFWMQNKGYRDYLVAGVLFSGSLVVHFLLRVFFSGSIVGDYASGMFTFSPLSFFERFTKTLARLFLPPIWNSTIFAFFAGILFILLAYIAYKIFKKLNNRTIYSLILIFGFSLAAPVMFPVSTRTSEGDRMLYFPSLFLCIIISYLIYSFKIPLLQRKVLIGVLVACFVVFLQINNSNWNRASFFTKDILAAVKMHASNNKRIILLNVPTEYNGAFIFRNGFTDALILHEIDTSFVHVASYMDIEQYYSVTNGVRPNALLDTIIVPPNARVWPSKDNKYILQLNDPDSTIMLNQSDEVWYWNKQNLVPVLFK